MSSPLPVPTLILASASPRRESLLREAGYEFTVRPSNFDESPAEQAGMLPSALALHLAEAKAHAIAEQFPEAVVLAADTVVAFGDLTIGKAIDADDARRILQLLSNTTHMVITAIAVIGWKLNFQAIERVMTAVQMRPLSDRQIDSYVESGKWQGKAGAYGLQDGVDFVDRVWGCRTNVVGLPIKTAKRLLDQAGIVAKPSA